MPIISTFGSAVTSFLSWKVGSGMVLVHTTFGPGATGVDTITFAVFKSVYNTIIKTRTSMMTSLVMRLR